MTKKNTFKRLTVVCLLTVVCSFFNLFTVANATEVEEPVAEATEVEEAAPAAASAVSSSTVAIVEVEDYTVEGGILEAGKEITINLTLHNTSRNVAATSVMMTLTSNSGMIYPVYGNSNQIYVGSIGAGASEVVSVPVSISEQFTGDMADLTCQFDYESSGNRMNNMASIVIPTSGGNTIGVKSIDVTTHAIVNGKSLLSFNYVNLSNKNITDAVLTIEGNVSSNSKKIKLDTIYAGKSYAHDYYVTFTKAGNQEINVKLSYTDVDGEAVETDLGNYSVTVSQESAGTATVVPSKILTWVGRAIAAIAGLAVVFVVVVYIKKR